MEFVQKIPTIEAVQFDGTLECVRGEILPLVRQSLESISCSTEWILFDNGDDEAPSEQVAIHFGTNLRRGYTRPGAENRSDLHKGEWLVLHEDGSLQIMSDSELVAGWCPISPQHTTS